MFMNVNIIKAKSENMFSLYSKSVLLHPIRYVAVCYSLLSQYV